ncbi:helix-turn-helix domain-containing protein [Eisenbergiella sp.]
MDTINRIQRAIDFVEDNIYDELNPDAIASQAYMSSFHFQRLFSVVCGVSLGEYIRNRRLTLSGTEIQHSDTKIIDIAFKYGYESPESFSRAFTRFHGISPMAARSQNGGLNLFAKISVESILGGNQMVQGLKERGYTVKENGPVYYTTNMDKTAKWFEDVLGWYAGIDQRNENGDGTYGCVLPLPGEIHSMTLAQFNGFHMFYGEPTRQTVAFMRVDNIDNLYSFVTKNGWTQISEITTQPWGGKECDVTTIDGGVMRFFQLD